MPIKINSPSLIKSSGNKPKIIEEYIGLVNSRTSEVSIAKMKSPPGWIESGQRPEFDEFTVVLKGKLYVKTEADEIIVISAGEAVIAKRGEWVQYSTPDKDGAEYISICMPAFSFKTVNRDE